VSVDSLERRYREVIEHARGDGETRILAKTFQAAMAGNMRALELSLINRCGWTLRPETIIDVTQECNSSCGHRRRVQAPLEQSQRVER